MQHQYSFRKLLLFVAAAGTSYAQIGSPTCSISAVPAIVRAEGVAERLGDIVFSCRAAAGADITGNLTLSLNTTITNHLFSNGTLDAVLTVNGALANASATLAANNQITFSGLHLVFPSSGTVEMRLSNVRADASFGGAQTLPGQFGSGQFIPSQVITGQLAFNPGGLLNFTVTNFSLGTPQQGLRATNNSALVPSQFGSGLPENITFSDLLANKTIFSSTRASEGFASAWLPRQSGEDSGTRIMLKFTGYPADARLFVPAVIAGSDADVPTAAGDFGGTPSGGRYTPGSGTLLLVRVAVTDPNGAGGFASASGLSYGQSGNFETMTEVQLTGGSGIAVYEVVDSNAQAQESAQIPVFIALPRSQSPRTISTAVQTTFAPISTSATATTFSPVPRFANIAATADCSIYRDCGKYTPVLGAPPILAQYRLLPGGVQQQFIPLSNEGGGLMPWTATVTYQEGSDWILLDRTSGLEPLLIRMFVRALTSMQPGTYHATVTIDAGSAGVARYPITLEVLPLPAPVQPTPKITSVVNGATFQTGPVARGSYVTLKGENLAGGNVVVTFDGKAAKTSYTSNDQINVLVPNDLTGNTSQVVVSVNGTASAAMTVDVASVSPGIFGVVNQDGTLNSATNPANTGSVVQVFATGLLAADGSGVIDVKLHDQIYSGSQLPYAGPAPGVPGVQQVNVKIPEGWPTMTTDILVCVTAGGSRTCSPPVRVSMRQVQ